MTQNYTLNDLIRLVYKDPSYQQHDLLQDLESDWKLREAYEELTAAARQLPKASFAPSSSSVARILRHSKATAVTVEI